MKISQAFPSKFLRAGELNGRAYVVQIRSYRIEDLGGGASGEPSEHKPVIYFEGSEKGLVLNKTNGFAIEAFLGDEMDNWVGKQIEIYPDRVLFGNEMKPCIRVREPVKAASGGLPGTPATTAATAPPVETQAGPHHDERNPPGLPEGLDDEIPF